MLCCNAGNADSTAVFCNIVLSSVMLNEQCRSTFFIGRMPEQHSIMLFCAPLQICSFPPMVVNEQTCFASLLIKGQFYCTFVAA